MLRVLIVDDEDVIRMALGRIFKKLGCEISEVDSIESALTSLSDQPCDLVLSDMRFPGDKSGTDLLEFVTEHNLATKVVLMSCDMEDEAITFLKSMGASKCMKKPFFKAECKETINSLFPEKLDVA